MKYFLFVFAFLIFSVGVDAQERYFHELRGFEDSKGTTQLYHRLLDQYSYICNSDYGSEEVIIKSNHIFHINIASKADTIKLYDGTNYYCTNEGLLNSSIFINDYSFIDKNPNKWIVSSTSVTVDPNNGVDTYKSRYNHNYISLGFNLINRLFSNKDSLYLGLEFGKATYKVPIDSDEWTEDHMFNLQKYYPWHELSDSLYFDNFLLAIHPQNEKLYYALDDSSNLLVSESYSANFTTTSSLINVNTKSELYFGDDSSTVYLFQDQELSYSNDLGKDGSWSKVDLSFVSENKHSFFFDIDSKTPNSIFIADSNSVFQSSDYGANFERLLDFDSQITGLYKKPNSNTLYVLTRTDLFRVENGQPTSIKQVTVNSETEPDIPEQIMLHQNYPNPFNPSTTIQFDLKESAFTKLRVYDLLGRKVRELVNEVRPAGTNTIQFDASDLASGVYLYRLEAGSVVQTKRLTLIK